MEEMNVLGKGEGGNIRVSSFSYDREKPWISSVGDW